VTETALMARHYVSLGISIVLNAASLLLLKHIALSGLQGELTLSQLPSIMKVALSLPFLVAICLFASGFFFWMYALARIDLSLAYPTVSSSYVIIALASTYMFNEQISLGRWLGIGIIIVGIIVMYRS